MVWRNKDEVYIGIEELCNIFELECVVLCCGVYDVYIVSLLLALGFGERGVGF
jgi:hypothetical protein